MKAYLTYYFFIASLVCLYAQNYNYIQYRTTDGLPINYVYGIVEDNNGYIWAHSELGISKFNGYEWVTYDSKNGIKGNDYPYVLVDSLGHIWGLSWSKSAFSIQNDSIILPEHEFPFISMRQYKDHISFNTKNKRIIFDQKFNEYQSIEITNNTLYEIEIEGQKHNISMSFDKVFHTVDDTIFNTIPIKNIHVSLFDHDLICYDSECYLFLILDDRIQLYNLRTSLSKSITYRALGFDDGNGLIRAYDYKKPEFTIKVGGNYTRIDTSTQVIDQFDAGHLYDQFDINTVNKDSKGNIWIATRNAGLLLIPMKYQKSQLILDNLISADVFEGIEKNDVTGQIFAASDNGSVFKIHPKVEQIFSYDSSSSFVGFTKNIQDNRLLYSNKLVSFHIDQNGNVASVLNNRPYNKHPAFNPQSPYLYPPEVKFGGGAFEKYDAEEDRYYIVNRNAIYLADGIHNYECQPIKQIVYPRGVIKGHDNGIVIYNDTKVYYLDQGVVIDSFETLKSDISTIHFLKDRLYLIGSSHKGLQLLNFKTKEVSSVMSCGMAKNIVETPKYIFIASYSGIYQLDKELNLINHFTTNDGLPSNEIYDVEIKDDQLLVALSGGIWSIDLLKTKEIGPEEKATRPLSITGIKVNDRVISELKDLSLNHHENDLRVDYFLLHYPSNGDITYEYLLTPEMTKWEQTKNLSLTFNNLAPGKYDFQLRAIDVYGNTYELNESSSFIIKKPLWERWWFRALLLGFFVLGVYTFIRYRSKQKMALLIKDNEIEKKLASFKLSALRSQMNPHFIFNALGAIQYYIQTHKTEDADAYLIKFALLMRRYLENSKSDVITIEEELELLGMYTELEMMRFEGDFKVKFNIEIDDHDLKEIFIPSMLIQPFVENAIIHGLSHRKGGKGILEISVRKINDQEYWIQVKDNGIGIKKAKEFKNKVHKSRGMQILSDKIDTLIKTGRVNITLNQSEAYPNHFYIGHQVDIYIQF